MQSADERTTNGIQFIAVHILLETGDAKPLKTSSQTAEPKLLPWDAPDILCRTRIDFDNIKSHPAKLLLQLDAACCQSPHRSKRNREEPDASPQELPVARAKMLPVPVVQSLPTGREIERCIDRNDVRFCLPDILYDRIVVEQSVERCDSLPFQCANAGVPFRTSCEVDADNDQRSTVAVLEFKDGTFLDDRGSVVDSKIVRDGPILWNVVQNQVCLLSHFNAADRVRYFQCGCGIQR